MSRALTVVATTLSVGLPGTTSHGGPAGRPRLAVADDISSSSPMGLVGLLSEVCDIVWVVDLAEPALGSMASDRSTLASVPGAVVEAAGIEYDFS